MNKSIVISLFAAAAFPLAALAAGTHAGGHDMPASHGNMSMSEHSAMFGQPGDPAKVTRTIDVVMNDNMRFDPGMVHSEPNQVNLKPGQRGTMVWQFTQPGKVDFACTEPGHLEAGMAGQVEVAR